VKLDEASDRLDVEFNPFTGEYIVEILQAVSAAWARMKQPKPREWEDDITLRLAGRLQNDPVFRGLPYDVVPQYWLLDMDGRRLGRLDLRFKHRFSQRDYFAFESKRLHVRCPAGLFRAEYSAYASVDGMGAFVEGQYSKNLPAAGMLGYVMDGNTGKAWSGLVKSIDSKREYLRLLASSQLVESEFTKRVKAGPLGICLGETEHALVSCGLRLFHLLLPVRQASDSALTHSCA
jgi:hypothetical protein